MAIFRTKSSSSQHEFQNQKITAQDISQYKVHTANLHDPILTAVNEQQPFEQAADHTTERRPSYLSNEQHQLRDVFGQEIRNNDMSNPARERNERPLDTIRGFEYAITGDMYYRDQLESQRLGWGFHEDFPYYNLQSGQQQPSSGPVHQFGGASGSEQAIYQAVNYSATSLKNSQPKKKKKGLFGKSKK